MTNRLSYGCAAIVVLAVEIAIAVFVHDPLVRPYGGDSLAVVLLYLGLRTVTPLNMVSAVGLALFAAFAIETGQFFNLLDMLGLRGNRVARIVLGAGFDPMDFVAYVAGAGAVLAIELGRRPRATS